MSSLLQLGVLALQVLRVVVVLLFLGMVALLVAGVWATCLSAG